VSVRVVAVDPRGELGASLSGKPGDAPGVELVATAHDLASTLLQADRTDADVVVLSAGMRGPLPRICAALRELEPRPRTLLVDAVADEEGLLYAIESGVDGYVSGTVGAADLAEAVCAIARGESVVPPDMLGTLLRRLIQQRRDATQAGERLSRLTPREREVFRLLVDGHDRASIATSLVISPETARTHVQRPTSHHALRRLSCWMPC
jgi:DNA-binding NarL/FixJ family response regulator